MEKPVKSWYLKREDQLKVSSIMSGTNSTKFMTI